MPNVMRKLPNRNLYRVYNRATKRVHAKATTKEKATKQLRLLHRLEQQRPASRRIKPT
jgi:hypothetical protein